MKSAKIPKLEDVEKAVVEAAMAWHKSCRNRTYDNLELAAVWDACALLDAIHTLSNTRDGK